MADVQPIFEWLVDGAPGAGNPAEVVEQMCTALVAAGVPVARSEAFVRTLHPHIVGRSFMWRPGHSVIVSENSWAYLESPAFARGPVGEVFRTGKSVRRRLGHSEADELETLAELARDGFTDFVALPLRFMGGAVHAITFATRAQGGFSDDHVRGIERLMRPLSRVAEILALARTAANLLDTYVGRNAGERILAGRIQRGHAESIDAVLWFSDLRGFTQMSTTLEPHRIVAVLNELFDCQVPAIERHGGEVLKFMGDGLLAIFPLDPDGAAKTVANAALLAADEAHAALRALNHARTDAGQPAIQFGLALHVGPVAYGNIGGSNRLDFTCIGPAVNLAARLEGLTGRLDRPLVVSAAFAELCDREMVSLGTFELKGVPEPAEVFAPG